MENEPNFEPYIAALVAYHKLAGSLEIDTQEVPATIEGQMVFAGICRVVADTPELTATYQGVLDAADGRILDPDGRAKAFDAARSVETGIVEALRGRDLISGHDRKQRLSQITDGTWIRGQAKDFIGLFAQVVDDTGDGGAEPPTEAEDPVVTKTPDTKDSLVFSRLHEETIDGKTFEVTTDGRGIVTIDGIIPELKPRETVLLHMLIEIYQHAPGAFITTANLRKMSAWREESKALSRESNGPAFALVLTRLRKQLDLPG